jgi:hypothetical protein
MFKIALLDDYQHLARRYADRSQVESWAEVTVFDHHLGSVDEAAEALEPFDAVCHIRERMAMPRELIERLPRLRFIGVSGRYHRTLDIDAAMERGITVSHTSSSKSGHGTSELAWSLIHALARHIPYEAEKMRHGGWQDTVGIQLWRRTLGLIHLEGDIGEHGRTDDLTGARPAGHDRRAAVHRRRYPRLDPPRVLLADDRADGGSLQVRVAGRESRLYRGESIDDLIDDGVFHVQALDGGTDLTGRAERRVGAQGDSALHVGVRADDRAR